MAGSALRPLQKQGASIRKGRSTLCMVTGDQTDFSLNFDRGQVQSTQWAQKNKPFL